MVSGRGPDCLRTSECFIVEGPLLGQHDLGFHFEFGCRLTSFHLERRQQIRVATPGKPHAAIFTKSAGFFQSGNTARSARGQRHKFRSWTHHEVGPCSSSRAGMYIISLPGCERGSGSTSVRCSYHKIPRWTNRGWLWDTLLGGDAGTRLFLGRRKMHGSYVTSALSGNLMMEFSGALFPVVRSPCSQNQGHRLWA